MCISIVSIHSAPLGFSHDVITFKSMKTYQGKWKTAAMLDYNEIVASIVISANTICVNWANYHRSVR